MKAIGSSLLVILLGCGNAPQGLDAGDSDVPQDGGVEAMVESGLDSGDPDAAFSYECVYGWGSQYPVSEICDPFSQRTWEYFSLSRGAWFHCTDWGALKQDPCISSRGYYNDLKQEGGTTCVNAPTTCAATVH